jgi:hypothetical protein
VYAQEQVILEKERESLGGPIKARDSQPKLDERANKSEKEKTKIFKIP